MLGGFALFFFYSLLILLAYKLYKAAKNYEAVQQRNNNSPLSGYQRGLIPPNAPSAPGQYYQ